MTEEAITMLTAILGKLDKAIVAAIISAFASFLVAAVGGVVGYRFQRRLKELEARVGMDRDAADRYMGKKAQALGSVWEAFYELLTQILYLFLSRRDPENYTDEDRQTRREAVDTCLSQLFEILNRNRPYLSPEFEKMLRDCHSKIGEIVAKIEADPPSEAWLTEFGPIAKGLREEMRREYMRVPDDDKKK